MISRDQLLAALGNGNVRAFAYVVRHGESSEQDIAYRMRYGGAHGVQYFDSFADHPRILVPIPNDAKGRCSSAAGAYQFTVSTWDDEVAPVLATIYPHVDFSPAMQDAGFVVLLSLTGKALQLVIDGQFDAAVAACRGRWTSLPGAAENHKSWNLAAAHAVYLQHGGQLSAAPIAVKVDELDAEPDPDQSPQEVETMGAVALPLLSSLIPQVLQLFSTRAQAQLTKVTNDPAVSAQFMQGLIQKVGEVANVPVVDDKSAVQAVAAVTANPDPAKVQALEDHALDYLDKLAPLIDRLAQHELAMRKASDDSADRAATRGQKDAKDIAPMLAIMGLAIFGIALLMVGGSLLVQMLKDSDHQVDPLLASLLTILIYAAARMAEAAYRYRFGGTADSQTIETGNQAARAAIPTRGGQ